MFDQLIADLQALSDLQKRVGMLEETVKKLLQAPPAPTTPPPAAPGQ